MVETNERLVGDAAAEDAAPAYGPVQGPKRDKLIAEAEALVHYVSGPWRGCHERHRRCRAAEGPCRGG